MSEVSANREEAVQNTLLAVDKPSQNGRHKPAIDMAVLAAFQAQFDVDQPELVLELVGLFFKNTPKLLSQMHQAVTQHDAKTINRIAHTLKSNSATFGAMTLANLCQDLENQTNTGLTAEVEVMAAHIRQAFNLARKELEHYLEGLQSDGPVL